MAVRLICGADRGRGAFGVADRFVADVDRRAGLAVAFDEGGGVGLEATRPVAADGLLVGFPVTFRWERASEVDRAARPDALTSRAEEDRGPAVDFPGAPVFEGDGPGKELDLGAFFFGTDFFGGFIRSAGFRGLVGFWCGPLSPNTGAPLSHAGPNRASRIGYFVRGTDDDAPGGGS